MVVFVICRFKICSVFFYYSNFIFNTSIITFLRTVKIGIYISSMELFSIYYRNSASETIFPVPPLIITVEGKGCEMGEIFIISIILLRNSNAVTVDLILL